MALYNTVLKKDNDYIESKTIKDNLDKNHMKSQNIF